jgi:hypothetical protein
MSLAPLFGSALFTPLEQFDNVNWLSSRGFETVDAYPLFVLETEFAALDRINNPLAVTRLY